MKVETTRAPSETPMLLPYGYHYTEWYTLPYQKACKQVQAFLASLSLEEKLTLVSIFDVEYALKDFLEERSQPYAARYFMFLYDNENPSNNYTKVGNTQ